MPSQLRIGGLWGDWLPLEGVLGSAPAAVATSAGHVDVVIESGLKPYDFSVFAINTVKMR